MTDKQTNVFDIPFEELKKFSGGEPLTSKKMNKTIETLNRMTRGVKPPSQVNPEFVPSKTAMAVVRDIGTGEERFISVVPIKRTLTTPWDFQWTYNNDDPLEKISCYPGLRSKHYVLHLWQGVSFEDETQVLTVFKIDGVWTAPQTYKNMLPIESLGDIDLGDCRAIQK